MKAVMVCLEKRAVVAASSLWLTLAAHAQSPAPADPFAGGGCVARADVAPFLEQHEGKILFSFEGNLLFNSYAEDTRLSFVRYRMAQGFRTALLARDRAIDPNHPDDKSKVCVLFTGDDRGSIANPREGLDGTIWWYQDYEEENAIARCKQLRPTIYSIWSSQLEEFGGKRTKRADVLAVADFYTENSAEGARRKQQAFMESLSTRDGDGWCASPAYLKNQAISDNRKLVALLTGKRFEFQKKVVAEPAVLLALYVSRQAGPKSLGWTLHIVQPSGATYRLATGHGFKHCDECFATPK